MKKICSIGEILFDIFDKDQKLGGAPFNFFYHIFNLTGQGNFISRIGEDFLGKSVLNFFNSRRLNSHYLQIDKIHLTGEAKPELDERKIPRWVIKPDTAYDYIELNDEIKNLLYENTSCLYFGTLAQRHKISRSTIQSLFYKGIKYFYDLNLRQNFFSKEIIEISLNAADVVKLNTDELKIVTNFFIESHYTRLKLADIAEIIMQKFNIDLLCITMGEEGAVLYKPNDSSYFKLPVDHKEIVDTVGAGDAYAAILCIGYLRNWDLLKINQFATEFALEIIKTEGAVPEKDSVYFNFKKK
jgi:fructokinase